VLAQLDIQDLVKFIEPVSFIRALNNMTQADILLLIQDKRFNKQIPGKVYEYLRTNRPMLVKADIAGETAKLAILFKGVELADSKNTLSLSLQKLINADKELYTRCLNNYNRESKANSLKLILEESIQG